MTESIKAFEWLLQAATSLLFLIPGYLVVRFLQTIRETKDADKFELAIQSLIFSLLIAALWFYISPPGHKLRLFLTHANIPPLMPKLLSWKTALESLSWLIAFSVVVALIAGYASKYQIYWAGIERLGFNRLNSYITTWEELSDLASGSWVSVETKNGRTYIGIISSVTHHPHERALILRRSPDSPICLIDSTVQADCEVERIWLSGDEITSIGVFQRQPESAPSE